MASKLVAFALTVLIYKVQSQAVCYCSNTQPASSNPSCDCGSSQPQTIQIIPTTNSNNCLKASPQLQILPGQGSLRAIPISQLLGQPQGCNSQRVAAKVPRQNVQLITPITPQVPSPAQCPAVRPPCNPAIITTPIPPITIPPTCNTVPPCTTVIDNTLANSLANALQILIAYEFIKTASCNNIINQDCLSPVIGSTGLDLCSLLNNLKCNQGCQTCQTGSRSCNSPNCQTGSSSCSCSSCQTGSTSCSCPTCQAGSTSCSCPTCQTTTTCDWESLLERFRDDQCGCSCFTDSDWAIILDYINSQIEKDNCYDSCYDTCCYGNEPENYSNDYSSLLNYLRQRGQRGCQSCDTSQSCYQQPAYSCSQSCDTPQTCYQQPAYSCSQSCDTPQTCYQQPTYSCSQSCGTPQTCYQQPNYYSSQSCDIDAAILDALAAYFGCNTCNTPVVNSNYPVTSTANMAEVIFPEEIPAQLICNFGYLPTTVPVVSFTVQPVDSSCGIVNGNQCVS